MMVSESQLASLYPSSVEASPAPAAPPAPAPKPVPKAAPVEQVLNTSGENHEDHSDDSRNNLADDDGGDGGDEGSGEPQGKVKPADVLLKNGAVEVSKELADFRNTQERKMYGTDPAIKENTDVKGYIDALGKHGIDEAGARSINTEVRALAGDLGLGRTEIAELKQSMGKEATAERVSNWQQSSITELNRYGQNAGKVLAEAKRIASLSPVSRTLMQDKRLGNSPVIAKALFKRAASNLGVSAK